MPDEENQATVNSAEYVAELKKHALPLIAFLRKYHDPCCEIRIKWDRCCITSEDAILPYSSE